MTRPTPTLKRFDLTVLKDYSSQDARQAPALNATVDFFLQGATLAPQSTVVINDGGTGSVLVYSPGAIQVGDDVQIGAEEESTLGVLSMTAGPGTLTTLQLAYGGPQGSVNLVAGNRLVLLARRPFVYDDPAGQTATTLHQRSDSGGRIRCYLRPLRFDFIVTHSNGSRLHSDAEASYVTR